MEEKEKNTKELNIKTREEVEKLIEQIVNSGTILDNLDVFSQLIDAHKDIENECYWKVKEEYYNEIRRT